MMSSNSNGPVSLRTYPAELRRYVEQALRYHFESEASGRGGYAAAAGGKSITAASCDRAAMLSMRARTCPTCQGTRRQTIHSPRRVIEIECLRCCGEGEIPSHLEPPPEAATTACSVCRGSGRYRKRGSFVRGRKVRRWVDNAGYYDACRGWFAHVGGRRVWQDNPDYDPKHELAWCVRCRGQGWVPCGVLVAGGDNRGGYTPSQDDSSSPVGAGMAAMRAAGYHESVLALELAYGEVGNYVRQRLAEPVEVAVWPLTQPGKLLIARLRLAKGTKPHRALVRVRHSTDPVIASMVAATHFAAVRTLELALARHYEGDAAGGGHTLRLARRLQEVK